ncbi:hypothetical protein I8752_27015 [Nostocaceae cyanobacterium CENA369]|uniref:Uncharacterized protein n=1 Tax=Dendronalium phyllosphericum CENA369 TaxID=1725256 RepID=A0A8J7LG30_9NOST|nr:hypothetical protein [Dendronalium phyllosphericum]MBH8576577.1 hypothetical protein [Dendronalium phyllosphericum CENA369]
MERNEIYGNQPQDNAIDFTPFLGTWINSNTKTKWIEKFILTKHNEQIIMHAYGTESLKDWGETEVTPFVDNINEKAFSAKFDRDSVESLLAANMNKGLWVIAAFHKFKDGSQPNFLCREFYYQVD